MWQERSKFHGVSIAEVENKAWRNGGSAGQVSLVVLRTVNAPGVHELYHFLILTNGQ
jgi:hypothetical protein